MSFNEPYNEAFLPLLQKYYSLETIAQEPWDNESVLYLPNKSQLLIDNGAESIATAIYLNLLNMNFSFKFVKNVNEMSPSGKSPLLKSGKYSIAEFEPIVNFCNLKGYKLLASYLDNKNKNEAKSYMLLIQKTFSDTLTYFLWKEPINQNLIKNVFRENYPWPLGDLLYFSEYRFIKNKLESSNLWNCDKNEVLNRFNQICESLNIKLDGNLTIIGNNLTEVDILLFSFLKYINLYQLRFESMLNCLHKYQNLIDFYNNLSPKFENFLNNLNL